MPITTRSYLRWTTNFYSVTCKFDEIMPWLSAAIIICSKCPPSVETHARWSPLGLMWHNFITVGDNLKKNCSPAHMGTCNKCVKFGLKIPNRLRKKYQKTSGEFFDSHYRSGHRTGCVWVWRPSGGLRSCALRRGIFRGHCVRPPWRWKICTNI